MSLTVNTKTYTADSFQKDVVRYVGPANTVSVKDFVQLARTAPKATAVFSGMGRTEAKLTRTLTLTGALTPTGDSILTVQIAVPVGAASADIDALCNDAGSYLSGASFKTLVKNQQISY